MRFGGPGHIEIDDTRFHDRHPIDRINLQNAVQAVEGDDNPLLYRQ